MNLPQSSAVSYEQTEQYSVSSRVEAVTEKPLSRSKKRRRYQRRNSIVKSVLSPSPSTATCSLNCGDEFMMIHGMNIGQEDSCLCHSTPEISSASILITPDPFYSHKDPVAPSSLARVVSAEKVLSEESLQNCSDKSLTANKEFVLNEGIAMALEKGDQSARKELEMR